MRPNTTPPGRRGGDHRWSLAVVLVLLTSGLAALLLLGTRGPALLAGPPAGWIPGISRVAVVVLENRGYRQVVGNPRAPYMNLLARRYALATRYYAVAHPSVPNYLALTGGSTFGIRSDCRLCDADAPNLVNQLSAAGISWKAYFEDLPPAGRLGMRTGLYTVHYNPFAYFETVSANALQRSRIVSFRSLNRDLALARLPRFSWIAPNLSHDGHSASLEATDRYVSKLVPRVIHALGPRGVLYLTWDEGSPGAHAGAGGVRGGGRVALIAAGGAARRSATTATRADHYALLRTIEAGFHLRGLGRAGSTSTPLLSGLLRPAPRGDYS